MNRATSDPAAALTRAFFDQWALYAEILRRDYMHHREIESALRAATDAAHTLRLLDLGCGDASIVAGAFGPGRLASYTGVDLSPVALAAARNTLNAVLPADRCELIEGHFGEFIAESTPNRFDAIIIGFALHHLQETEKRAFFKDSARILAGGGTLWVYDVFRRPHESRASYLDAYRTLFIDRWDTIATKDRQHIDAHVRSSDFPETPATILAMAAEAGFAASADPLFAEQHRIHCLYRFDVTDAIPARAPRQRSNR